MSEWASGYVSDIEYISGFYAEQAPAELDLTALICGVEPPRRMGETQGFDYCEIGCGTGSTIAALAAANPEGRFVGIDFMPAHIARAEALRAAAGLDNLRLIEADVAGLADRAQTDLPMFDYVTLHGVYSWVAPHVRAGIVRFLARHLRPGGLVYVSYNVLPGWHAMIPMQKLLFEIAARVDGDSIARARAGSDFIERCVQAGAPMLGKESFQQQMARSPTAQLAVERDSYLAHEFLNANWQPMYHMDLAKDLADAKLVHVGSAKLVENFAGVGLSPEAAGVLDTMPDGPLRETVKDYFNGRIFRRDVFVRGRRGIDPIQREMRLAAVRLVTTAPPPAKDHEASVLGSTLTLHHAAYAPLFKRMAEDVPTVDDLVALSRAHGRPMSGTEILGMLAGLKLATPVQRDVTGEGVEACRRHNRAVAEAAFRSTRQMRHALAVPVGHGGQALSPLEIALLDGLFAGLPPEPDRLAAHILQRAQVDPDEIRDDSGTALGVGGKVAPGEDGTGEDGAGEDGAQTPRGPADDLSQPMGVRVRAAVEISLREQVPGWVRLGVLSAEEAGAFARGQPGEGDGVVRPPPG